MRKAEAQDVPTLSEVVHRAVEVCDPIGTDDGATAMLERFLDRDEPVTAVADIETELAEAKGAVDPRRRRSRDDHDRRGRDLPGLPPDRARA
jgi:hypothetical protein